MGLVGRVGRVGHVARMGLMGLIGLVGLVGPWGEFSSLFSPMPSGCISVPMSPFPVGDFFVVGLVLLRGWAFIATNLIASWPLLAQGLPIRGAGSTA
jgi:hypothetical protein